MADLTCVAEGLGVPADFEQTGLNLNELVVGPIGCGKSFSNGYSTSKFSEFDDIYFNLKNYNIFY